MVNLSKLQNISSIGISCSNLKILSLWPLTIGSSHILFPHFQSKIKPLHLNGQSNQTLLIVGSNAFDIKGVKKISRPLICTLGARRDWNLTPPSIGRANVVLIFYCSPCLNKDICRDIINMVSTTSFKSSIHIHLIFAHVLLPKVHKPHVCCWTFVNRLNILTNHI